MNRLFLRPLVLLVTLGVLVAAGFGQTAGTGAIAGTVTDPSGAVVAGAGIKTIDMTTNETRTAVSSNSGTYLVPLLRPSTYRVEATKSGFMLSVSPDIVVHITETVTINLQLAVGAHGETITVSAASELLNTQDSALGHVVDEKEVTGLPLVTRSYIQILALSPGVSAESFNAGEIGHGGQYNGAGTGTVSNGSAASDNNFQMNGVEINDLQGSGSMSAGVAIPNPDAIQEFKVQTSQYDASYGRNAGANVNVLTKGGSNNFHGSAWEFFRNDVLNANTYFRKQAGQPRPELRQNQFGAAFGGPVIKNKLQFFTSYQGTRQRNGIDPNCSSTAVLPLLTTDRTAAGLAASVNSSTIFGGVPSISAQAQALFNAKLPNGDYLIPNPQITQTIGGKTQGFSAFSSACRYTEDQFMTNLDWQQSAKSTFQGRFFFANSQGILTLPQGLGNSLPGSPEEGPQNFRNFSLTQTYLFSPHLVNQASFGFHRTYAGTLQSYPISYSGIGSTVPITEDKRAVIAVLGSMSIGGQYQNVVIAQNTFVFTDNLSWIHGRHSLRFGGGITRAQDNFSNYQLGAVSIFTSYANLMSDGPTQVIDMFGIMGRNWRVWDSSLYFQDDIKVTKRFTLNVGFRYERLGDFGEINGRNSTINLANVNRNPGTIGSVAGFVVSSGYPGTIPAGVTSSGNNLGINGDGQNTINPRFGFAWSLPGTDRLVLRAGWGAYHQRATGQPFTQMVANQPFSARRQISGVLSFASPFAADPGAFPQFSPYIGSGASATKLSPVFLSPTLRPPFVQKYSMSLQAQLAKDLGLEIGYVGARSTHLFIQRQVNQAHLVSPTNPDPITGVTTNTTQNVQSRVTYPGFSTSAFSDVDSIGFGWYNSLQASLSKRFSHGLQFLASYTFARALTNANNAATGGNGGTIIGDQNNPMGDWGPDPYVRPHRFVMTTMYSLPGPKDLHSFRGELLGGWKLTGVILFQSGQRLPVLNKNNKNIYGITTDFAGIVPGCDVMTAGSTTERLTNWINRSCFLSNTTPATVLNPVVGNGFGWGNSRMGAITGPGQFNTDLSVAKSFPVKWPNERTNIEFRSEFFNVFNHPLFGTPDNTVSSATFGQITNTVGNPRIIQFALKLNF